jgi:hypothetical protein
MGRIARNREENQQTTQSQVSPIKALQYNKQATKALPATASFRSQARFTPGFRRRVILVVVLLRMA